MNSLTFSLCTHKLSLTGMIFEKMLLKDYLKKVGVHGAKKLASQLNVHWNYLYNLASGLYSPSAELAIDIHKKTKGEVTYREALGEGKAEKTHPSDMFKEIDDWKNNA